MIHNSIRVMINRKKACVILALSRQSPNIKSIKRTEQYLFHVVAPNQNGYKGLKMKAVIHTLMERI